MKKWLLFTLVMMLLTGCGKPIDYETMSDRYVPAVMPEAAQIQLSLPEDAAVLTLADESGGALYLCEDYSIAVQTLPAGNLDSTLRELTGYGTPQLQLYSWQQDKLQRHECVWTSAAETGDQVGKMVLLDDGVFHYAVCMMMPAEKAEALTAVWQQISRSVRVE